MFCGGVGSWWLVRTDLCQMRCHSVGDADTFTTHSHTHTHHSLTHSHTHTHTLSLSLSRPLSLSTSLSPFHLLNALLLVQPLRSTQPHVMTTTRPSMPANGSVLRMRLAATASWSSTARLVMAAAATPTVRRAQTATTTAAAMRSLSTCLPRSRYRRACVRRPTRAGALP